MNLPLSTRLRIGKKDNQTIGETSNTTPQSLIQILNGATGQVRSSEQLFANKR